MRNFSYEDSWKKLLTPQIVAQLTKIHEFKGEQSLFIEAKPDVLTQLVEIAKIQSTGASNKIEGIYTSDERLKKLVTDKTRPRNRNEQEIAGYRDVLAIIHESHDFIPPKPSIILQLHRDLYKFSGSNTGGVYKIANNIIAQEDEEGNQTVRFLPVEAWETAEAMEQLCKCYEEVLQKEQTDPLLIIPMFVLDFLCIHPFQDAHVIIGTRLEKPSKINGFALLSPNFFMPERGERNHHTSTYIAGQQYESLIAIKATIPSADDGFEGPKSL